MERRIISGNSDIFFYSCNLFLEQLRITTNFEAQENKDLTHTVFRRHGAKLLYFNPKCRMVL